MKFNKVKMNACLSIKEVKKGNKVYHNLVLDIVSEKGLIRDVQIKLPFDNSGKLSYKIRKFIA